MKLHYRGVNYDSEPSMADVTEGETGGTYRGHSWKIHKPKLHRRRPGSVGRQESVELTYRGVTYRRS
jgi:hypothetical protein